MKLDALLSVIVAAAAFAADGATPAWPGFRGPNSSGVAAGATPPINISPTNSVLWKVQVPWSPSSPCIWDDQIFLTTFSDNELQTRCYHRQDGTLAWIAGIEARQTGDSFTSPKAALPPPRPPPTATVGQLFRLFRADLLRPPRARNFGAIRCRLPSALAEIGTASSPLIAGNLVVINRDQDQRLLPARGGSGARARQPGKPPAPTHTAALARPSFGGTTASDEVITPGSLRLKGYALKTGLEDWVVQGTASFACTTPVVGDGLLFFAAWSNGKADAPMAHVGKVSG